MVLNAYVCHAEVVLSKPGTYQLVNAEVGPGAAFITLICADSRTTPFTINLSGTTFVLTVRPQRRSSFNRLCLDRSGGYFACD